MAVTKDSIDYSDFVSPREANKLSENTIRKAFEYDIYDGKNSFIALVLTNPILVTSGEIALEVGAAQPRIADQIADFVGVQATDRKIGKIVFRARIIGPNSPHNFIPNPCESKEFAEETLGDEYEETRLKLISMHTAFYTTQDFAIGGASQLPTEGQFVEVFLDRGDSGAFNLQKGRYQGTIVNLADARQQLGNLEIPWALVGGGPEFAFKSRGPGKRQPLPSWALNKVGMPFKGNFPVTSPWGPPGSTRVLQASGEKAASQKRHGGIDFGTPAGTEILAIAPGKVTKAQMQGDGTVGYGGYVTIQHTNKDYEQDPGKTVYSVYAHLQSWPVSVGKTVEAGDVIGIVAERGARGRGSTTGPHLHLEVWVNAPYSPSKDFKYGQGPPITQTQNSTTGYSVDFWEWYIDNARKLGQTGPPERTNEDPPTQSSTAGTNAGSTEVTEGSERRQETSFNHGNFTEL